MALVPSDLLSQLTTNAALDTTTAHLGHLAENADSALHGSKKEPSDVMLNRFEQMWQFYNQYKNIVKKKDIEIPIRDVDVQPAPAPRVDAAAQADVAAPARAQARRRAPALSVTTDDDDDSDQGTPPSTPMSQARLLRGVAKSAKDPAQRLVTYLAQSHDVNWDNNGQVWLKGKLIPGASMDKLVKFMTNYAKKQAMPAGCEELTRYLAGTTINQAMLPNPQVRTLLRSQRVGTPIPLNDTAGSDSFGTPAAAGSSAAAAAASPSPKPAARKRKKTPQRGSGLWVSLYK